MLALAPTAHDFKAAATNARNARQGRRRLLPGAHTGRSQFTLLHELALAIHREHVISSIVYSLNVISYDKNAPGHMFAIHTLIAKCSNGFTLVEADVCMLVSTLFSNEIVQKPGCNS